MQKLGVTSVFAIHKGSLARSVSANSRKLRHRFLAILHRKTDSFNLPLAWHFRDDNSRAQEGHHRVIPAGEREAGADQKDPFNGKSGCIPR